MQDEVHLGRRQTGQHQQHAKARLHCGVHAVANEARSSASELCPAAVPGECGITKSFSAHPGRLDQAVTEYDQCDEIHAGGRQIEEGLLRRGDRQLAEAGHCCTYDTRVSLDALTRAPPGGRWHCHMNIRCIRDDAAPDPRSRGMTDVATWR